MRSADPPESFAPELSVIVPCYNAAPYLSRCLDSLISQTLPGIEIIVVDDGSTDATPTLLQRYARRHANIHLIRQRNCGVSTARNAGLAAARGRHVAFVDADDVVRHTMYAEMLRFAHLEQLDVAICNAWSVGMDGAWRLVFPAAHCGACATGADWMTDAVARGCLRHYIWCHLYRRDFIEANRLRFEPGITHQDIVWTNEVLLAARRVALLNRPLYVYCQRAGSLSKPGSDAGNLAAARHYVRVATLLDRLAGRAHWHPAASMALRRQVVDEGVAVFHLSRRLPRGLRHILYAEVQQTGLAAMLFRDAVDSRAWWRVWRRSLRCRLVLALRRWGRPVLARADFEHAAIELSGEIGGD